MFTIFKKTMLYSARYKKYLAGIISAAIAGTLFSLFVPILCGRGVDLLAGEGEVSFGALYKLLPAIAACTFFGSILQWLVGRFSAKLAFLTIRDIRKDVYAKLFRIPLSPIDRTPAGEIISRCTTDIDIISDGLIQEYSQFFSGVVTIAATFAFMLYVDVRCALAVLLLTPFTLIVSSTIARKCSTAFRRQAQERGKLSSRTIEAVECASLSRSIGFDPMPEFTEANESFRKAGQRAIFFSALVNPCTRFVNGLIYAVIAGLGAFLAVKGEMSVGAITSLLAYVSQFARPFNEISSVLSELQNSLASAERVFEFISQPDESADEGLPALETASADVSFRDVSFSYSPETSFIENMSFSVSSGEQIAIVGRTGCGKTTLINLLLRFYDTSGGEILVSGQDIADVTRKSVRESFAMVLQDAWIFTGTIAENIAFGSENASRAEIVEAARAAHLHSAVSMLPDGYDTLIDDDSVLSQGQRQLIAIARVLLHNPPMLILDEATSSIDLRTEVHIRHIFERLMKNRTSFIIAHRLNTIMNADLILVMDNGKIVEQGRHAELIKLGGVYSELFTANMR